MTQSSPAPEFTDTDSELVAEVIRSRRTIHLFEPEALPSREEILTAIDLARWAPNHFLTEPWRFYILGRQTADAIAHLNAEIVTAARGESAGKAKLERWLEIPGWLIVTCRVSDDQVKQREDYAACCCAIQNLQLYLWSRGIGCKWTTGDVVRTERFYEIIDVDPAQETLVSMLWYGFPKEVPKQPRKPVKQILEERL